MVTKEQQAQIDEVLEAAVEKIAEILGLDSDAHSDLLVQMQDLATEAGGGLSDEEG